MAKQKETTSAPPLTESSSKEKEEAELKKKSDTNYSTYHSSREEFISDAQPTLNIGQIVETINHYCMDAEMRPPHPISEDMVNIARYLLNWASKETQALLSRGNCREDVESTHGYSRAAQKCVRVLTDGLLGGTHPSKQTPLCKELMVLGGTETVPEVDATVRPLTALYYKAGNCHEYAMVALQCILAGAKAIKTDIIQDACIYNIKAPDANGEPDKGSHAYLVLKIKGSDDLLICDPWNNLVGTYKELEKELGLLLPGSVYGKNETPYVPKGSLGILKNLSESGIDVFELLKVWRTGGSTPKNAENLMKAIKSKCARFESLEYTAQEETPKEIAGKPGWLYAHKTISKQPEPPSKDTTTAPPEPQVTPPSTRSSS
jgi:hypothetical protein